MSMCYECYRVLFLNYNAVSGSVPSYLSLMPNLAFLGLAGNLMVGSMPSTITLLTKLQ